MRSHSFSSGMTAPRWRSCDGESGIQRFRSPHYTCAWSTSSVNPVRKWSAARRSVTPSCLKAYLRSHIVTTWQLSGVLYSWYTNPIALAYAIKELTIAVLIIVADCNLSWLIISSRFLFSAVLCVVVVKLRRASSNWFPFLALKRSMLHIDFCECTVTELVRQEFKTLLFHRRDYRCNIRGGW
jgi:hypothetical protein